MNPSKQHLTRDEAIKRLIVLPSLAGFLALSVGSIAQAADNKKQFKYQSKPGKNGQKCSGCNLFIKPDACKVVTGKISPNGWCIAWAPKK
jgi:High potential iron-sulfur protein